MHHRYLSTAAMAVIGVVVAGVGHNGVSDLSMPSQRHRPHAYRWLKRPSTRSGIVVVVEKARVGCQSRGCIEVISPHSCSPFSIGTGSVCCRSICVLYVSDFLPVMATILRFF